MIICEVLLLAVMAVTLVISTRTDSKSGIVHNKILIATLSSSIAINTIYYSCFAGEYFLPFIVNGMLVLVISFLLYYFGIWGAGDSKLFTLGALSLPGRIFCTQGIWSFPGFLTLAIVFAVSFAAALLESIHLRLSGEKKPKKETKPFSMSSFLSYLSRMVFGGSVIGIMNLLLFGIILRDQGLNPSLIYAVNLVLVLLYREPRGGIKWFFSLISFGIFILLCIIFKVYFHWSQLLFTIIIIMFRLFTNQLMVNYNYLVFPASEAVQGMILDYSTILRFQGSDIPGLPKKTTADMRSRITWKEAEAIRSWGAKAGKNAYIVILRKVPFVLYITIGTFLSWIWGVMIR